MSEEKVSSVAEFIQVISSRATTASWGGPSLRFWYRGQSNGTWSLRPLIFRDNVCDQSDEERRLRNEHVIFLRFRNCLIEEGYASMSPFRQYIMQQHYGLPTRLLDWTSNPLNALYFACTSTSGQRSSEEQSEEVDGAVFVIEPMHFAHHQPGAKKHDFIGVAHEDHPTLNWYLSDVFTRQITDMKRQPASSDERNFVVPVSPPAIDHRVSRQTSCFTLHSPHAKSVMNDSNKSLKSIVISRESKVQIACELRHLGINDYTVFGGLDHAARILRVDILGHPKSQKPEDGTEKRVEV